MRYLSTSTDKQVSKIGLGTWQFGSREWGYGDRYATEVAQAIVGRALELGVTLFDTAEIYGFGRSERILGQALGEQREAVFLATKILPVLPVAPVVEQRAVASANRLGARRLDLYQVHQPNPVVRDRTIMRGMRALQRVGLVGEVGVSNYSLARWRAAEDALGGPVLSNQVPYSLVARSPEHDLLPYASAHGRVVLAYSPLAQGLLSARSRLSASSARWPPRTRRPRRRSPWPGSSATRRWPRSRVPPASSSWSTTWPPPRSISPTTSTRRWPRRRTGSSRSPGPPSCPAWPGPGSAADLRVAADPRAGRAAAGPSAPARPGRPPGCLEVAPMFALAVTLTVLLLLETLPSATAGLFRARAGLARLDQLTRLGLLEGRHLWVATLLGAVHLVGSAAVITGLFIPAVGVAGGALEAAAFGWVLSRQLRHGDRGRALGAYLLFIALALAVLIVDALRL